jgi:hypothetical protein
VSRFAVTRRIILRLLIGLLLSAAALLGQEKRLWVLRAPGEIVEYDLTTFAVKQTVKVPPEALTTPGGIEVNHPGQILFAEPAELPLAAEDVRSPHQVWFWNGHTASTIDQGVKREVSTTGSNQAVTELAPNVHLSADGAHLYWFANQARRLQREEQDLSTSTTWQAWRTDLTGGGREDLATVKLADCPCETAVCTETCPYCGQWTPPDGIDKFFLMTQFVAGQTEITYHKSMLYQEQAGKWTATPLDKPLERELDAASGGDLIVEAIPDAGCCGWSNESNDQTLVLGQGKTRVVFDERSTFKNPDYDVSFYTSNARLSPDLGSVAMTIVSTAEPNRAIQLSEEGQANPEESEHIRKALADLPAVEVKSVEDPSKRLAFVPHSTLVGWISEKELLILDDHALVLYNVGTGARKKSSVRVEDAGRVFLR